MKIDISKAFNTLDWEFLLKVLQQFGFDQKFCLWIKNILNFAYLSVSINGAQKGYFQCKRGVRQGDPLSPLLFCIAEDVLIRGISKLVEEGKLDLIKASSQHNIPSHVLYADDIILFCKGKISCIKNLQKLFTDYALCLGQIINAHKSTLYSDSIPQARINSFIHLLGFQQGSFPFNYLGSPIFKGKPKAQYFLPLADKIKSKLASWKASLLPTAGRVQMVKAIIQGMLIHTITIYN